MKQDIDIRDSDNLVKRLVKPWGRFLANCLTLSRLLLVPVFLILYGKGAFLACLLIMLGIGLSDILDGFVARKWGSPAVYGAVLDAGVDFAVVFTLCIFYCVLGVYPLLLLIMMALSFGLFALTGFFKKAMVKSRFGKYSGAVLYFGLTLSVAARVFFPDIPATADGIAVFLSLFILAISIIENLAHLYRWRYHNR